jgi:hypothetical protein
MNKMLKTFLKILFLLICLPVLFIKCKPANDIIEQDTFVEIYAHLTIISEMQIPINSKQSLSKKLFTQHNITEDRFKLTVSHYHQTPEKWIFIIEQVKNKIQELKQLYQSHGSQKKNGATDDGATTNQPQGFIGPQRQNPRNSQAGPDTSAKRSSR